MYGGLLGSFSDGRVTDGSWKCTLIIPSDRWTSSTYDDSSWPNALATEGQGGKWSPQPKVAINAKWIWACTSYVYNKSASNTAYFRKKIGTPGVITQSKLPDTATNGTPPSSVILYTNLIITCY